MIGAYYETQTVTPINGLGALGAPASMNDEATQAILGLLTQLQPVATVIPWATLDDSSGKWVPSVTSSVRYQLFSVSAAILDTAQRLAFGQPVGFVCVVDGVRHSQPSDLFDGTPWEYFESDAVFDESEVAEPPKIRFLYWGKLRDEGAISGNASTLEAHVKTQGGQLVYPVNLPVSGRPLPTTPFDVAMQRQFGVAQSSSAASSVTSSPSPSTGPSSPALSTASSGWGKLILLSSLAGVAGYITYRIVRKR